MAVNSTKVSTEKASLDRYLLNEIGVAVAERLVLANLIINITEKLRKGDNSITMFDWGAAGEPEDTKEDGTEQGSNGFSLQNFQFVLNHDEKFNDYIYDKGEIKSVADYRAGFLKVAPIALAKMIEKKIATAMRTAAVTTITCTGTSRAGTANAALSLDDLQAIAEAMDNAGLPADNRVCMVTHSQKHELIKAAGLTNASTSGTTSALVDAEFARLYGFRLMAVGTNILPAADTNQAMAFHQSACMWGYQDAPKYEEERQASKSRTYLGMRQVYGIKVNTTKDFAGNTPDRIWLVGKGTP